MTDGAAKSDLAEALAALQKDRESLPWPRRREVARALAETLSTLPATEDHLALVRILAEDPKWEVRSDIADLLLMLPLKDFKKLAGALAEDSHAYVRSSAERALVKRARAELEDRHAKRGIGRVASQLEAFERQHGPVARKRAHRICETYKDMIVRTMLHDLRSILTHLKSNGTALIREAEAEGKASAKKRAARLADDLEFLERTLNDMGEFSTPPKLDNRREKVREVVKSALEMARSNVQADGFNPGSVAVVLKVPQTMVFDVTKPLAVMALANVLKNAFESYAKPDGTLAKGKVTIEAKQDGDATRLSIRDGGKGFSDDEWTAYQALLPGRANKSKRRSTGYGLAITRRNIEVHGGKVHVRTKEDKGTTVTITLPAGGKGR